MLRRDKTSQKDAFQPRANERYRMVPERGIVEMLLLAGWAFEVDAGRRHWAEGKSYDALESWIANGLGYRLASDGQRMFDPVEVTNFLKWAGLTGQDPFWAEHYVRTGRQLVSEFRRGQIGGKCLTDYGPNRFRMRLRRYFCLHGMDEGAKVRLRAPVPLVRSDLHNLEIKPISEIDCDADVVLQADRIEVRFLASGSQTAVIGADVSFVATSSTDESACPILRNAELYLRKVEGFVRVTPRVAGLAASLCGECRTDREAIAALWAYMMDELVSGMIRYGEISVATALDWVLDWGWYDCQLGSALLVSLCRARGIPARIVSGQLLYRLAPITHFWAEIWIAEIGWSPFDLICWDLSEGGLVPAWRDTFAGQVDYRAVTQCFPLAFTGPMSVRLPPHWQILEVSEGNGVNAAYLDVKDGSLVYRDHIEVENLGAGLDMLTVRQRKPLDLE